MYLDSSKWLTSLTKRCQFVDAFYHLSMWKYHPVHPQRATAMSVTLFLVSTILLLILSFCLYKNYPQTLFPKITQSHMIPPKVSENENHWSCLFFWFLFSTHQLFSSHGLLAWIYNWQIHSWPKTVGPKLRNDCPLIGLWHPGSPILKIILSKSKQ